jgi:uncharacterized protein (DUF2235 family)
MTEPEPPSIDLRLPGPAPHEVRQLVVCCDGTNNTLTGGQRDTNVLLLFEQLSRQPIGNQRLYYDPGVGSPDGLPATGLFEPLVQMAERAISLAIGRGIYENIGQAYLFLCREYRRGDQIWLFGFSRGAFTVRAVAGMVHMFGLVRPEHEPLLPTLLRIYFAAAEDNLGMWTKLTEGLRRILRGGRKPPSRKALAEQVRLNFTDPDGRVAPVHFTGVWDTVESVGVRGLRKSISNKALMQGKRLVHVRHALSLDEHRYAFLPRYYEDRVLDPGQTLAQVWFRGVHSDVGGGAAFAPQAGLSRIALDWMVAEADAAGLRCAPVPAAEPAPEALLHDQIYATPWWAVAGMALRRPQDAPGGNVDGLSLDAPAEHASVAVTPPTRWAQWRSWGWFAFALVWCALWVVLSGAQLLPDGARPGWSDPSGWRRALEAGADLAWQQFAAFWQPLEAWATIGAQGAATRALWLDGLFIVGYAYLLARLASRAFAWLARWRRVGAPRPSWDRLPLGRALPTMLIGDAVENVLGLAALCVADPRWSPVLLWLGSFGSVAKWLGLAGVLLLALMGWRGRRHPELAQR